MLRAKAEITFNADGKDYINHILRPVFKLGDELYSGQIESNHENFYRGQPYIVNIAFFLVYDEAYIYLEPIIKDGMIAPMQAGSKVIGTSRLWDFEYEPRKLPPREPSRKPRVLQVIYSRSEELEDAQTDIDDSLSVAEPVADFQPSSDSSQAQNDIGAS